MNRKPIPLLPYEKYLASQFGLDEEQYQWFKAEIVARSGQIKPGEPTAGFVVPILVNLLIGVGLSLLSALLFPPKKPRDPASIDATREGGRQLRNNQTSSPRFGFSSFQNIARAGQSVPVVVAKREVPIGEVVPYGGVRVNLPLIWSRMRSLNGSQFFQGIFLAGATPMPDAAWDNRGWAFGNNTFGAYAYTGIGEIEGGRFTLYYRPEGGRIFSRHRILGRIAGQDPGNAMRDGGPDVFSFRGLGDQWAEQFCMAETPSTSNVFGLFSWCPNAMLYRTTTAIRPTMQAQIDSNNYVVARDDTSALCDIWESKFHWSMRGAIVELRPYGQADWQTVVASGFALQNIGVSEGDRVRYVLGNATDSSTTIKFDTSNSAFLVDNDSASELKATTVGAGVASRQSSADAALSAGELYRIGSAWAVLEEREPAFNPVRNVFVSDQDEEPPGNGTSMTYQFVIVRAGVITFASPDYLNPPEVGTTILPPAWDRDSELSTVANNTYGRYKTCSGASQIFRMAVGSVSSIRETRLIEIGLKSRVGISVTGMTEFRSCPTIKAINDKAGYTKHLTFANGTISTSIYQSNVLSTRIKRYSIFSMSYRRLADGVWTLYPEIFAVAGVSQEDIYSFIRIEFPVSARWEVRLEPISSWELRSGEVDNIRVLDSRGERERFSAGAGVFVTSIGYRVNPLDPKIRKLQQLDPAVDIGIGWSDLSDTDNSMTDLWGSFAEGFCYDEITTSVDSQPEHQIVYVNYQSTLGTEPSYDSLAIVGVNLAATQELGSLPQFSGYCLRGYKMRQLLNGDSVDSTHLFPDWLRELMTSENVGPNPPLPDFLIDRPSFQQAAQWCYDRNYFYDAVVDQPLNLFSWASDVAQAHLLKLQQIGGKYYLKPAINFTSAVPIAALFTAGNIREGSFRLETADFADRQPIQVIAKWREEADLAFAGTEAMFAQERAAVVREASTSANAALVDVDLSDWCTNWRQAIDAACYLIRFRRLAGSKRIFFDTTPDAIGAQLSVGDVIKVAIDVTRYDQSVHGFVTADGVAVTTRPDLLPTAPGSYFAILWDGSESNVTSDSLVINAQGEYSPASHFFALETLQPVEETYEISSLNIGQDGVISVEAFYHPLDTNGFSLLGRNWTTYASDQNWIIEL